ncbi:Aprataxin [Vanrija pseudolonga]|uniref:Aprataxin n=1 Tax=Vanrija pseudolonga TaxID=143232 RepID=A0AAF0Y096_9TREE|nr:Aprataxin [Vanrija pseudolonga]
MQGLNALRTYAETANPAADIPPSTLLLETPHCIAIFDAYPKARYHFLVLPRLPCDHLDSSSPPITARDLDSLASLLRHPARDAVLAAVRDAATEVQEMIRDEMHKTEGWQWPVSVPVTLAGLASSRGLSIPFTRLWLRISSPGRTLPAETNAHVLPPLPRLAGFHAVPSMRHLHLHVMSNDLASPSLKTKKHYNSFRPDHGFFISLAEVESWCSDPGVAERQAGMLESREQLLRDPLVCFKCHAEFRNMPLLKEHLEAELAKERRAAGRN